MNYPLSYILFCEFGHFLFALVLGSAAFCLTWIILRHFHVRHIWLLSSSVGVFVAFYSHYFADVAELGV